MEKPVKSEDNSTKSTQHQTPKEQRHFNFGHLFWGILLIFIGSMFILDNFNVIDFDFSNLWRLWPILVIAAGISILPVKGWISVTLMSILTVALLGFLAVVSLGYVAPNKNTSVTTKNIEVSRQSEEIKSLQLAVSGGAGQIDINSSTSGPLVRAKLESNFTQLRHNSIQRNGIQITSIEVEAQDNWWHGNYRNDLFVTVTESIPVNLSIDAGASKISGDLSQLQLRNLDIDTGASDVKFKIGSRAKVTDIAIDMGMSSFELLVPKASGVSLQLDSGLSSRNLPALQEMGDGYYESENYTAATNKINIRGKVGMSNLQLVYY